MKNYIGITKPINIVSEKASNVDAKYGIYNSIQEAIDSIPAELRDIGLTVGIKTNERFNEYWWRDNTLDTGLVLKVSKSLSDYDNDLNYAIKEDVINDINILDDKLSDKITIETNRAIGQENKLFSQKADLSLVQSITQGVRKLPSVDTYNITSGGKTSLLNTYKTPKNGDDCLVKTDETKGGKANRYVWNSDLSIWVSLDYGVYDENVATKQLLNSINNVSLVRSGNGFIPNIDTTNNTLDLGEDPVIVIGNKTYAMRGLHPGDSDKYRKISLLNEVNRTANVLYFNIITKSFIFTRYNDSIPDNCVLIGAFRKEGGINDYTSIELPFKFRVNEVLSNNNAKLGTDTVNIPNIDIDRRLLDLGEDAVLILDGKTIILKDEFAHNPSIYRKIPILGGITTITYDFYNKRFRSRAAILNGNVPKNESVLGVVRMTREGTIHSSLGIDITINGNAAPVGSYPSTLNSLNDLHNYADVEGVNNRVVFRFPIYVGFMSKISTYSNSNIEVAFLTRPTNLRETLYDSGWQTEIDYIEPNKNARYREIRIRKSDNTNITKEEALDGIESFYSEYISNRVDTPISASVLFKILNSVSNDSPFVTLIPDIDFHVPTIDVASKTLDLGADPILIIGKENFTFKILDIDPDVYRKIDLVQDVTGSTAKILYFNKTTYRFKVVKYNNTEIVNLSEYALIGAYRTDVNNNIFDVNLPFNFKYSTDKDVEVSGSTTNNINHNDEYIAHRGVHLNNIAPENSIDSVRLAGRMGFGYIETDFLPTSDGELVLMHDDSINRTMRNASDYSIIKDVINVKDNTLEDLRNGYVLASNNVRMRKPIPTLEEYFIACRDNNIFPVPEIKSTGTTNADVLKAYELGRDILGDSNFGFASFSAGLLDYARSLSNDIKLWYITDSIINTKNSITGNSREDVNNIWYPNYTSVSKEIIASYKQRGMKVAVWTVPNYELNNLLRVGVDQIATDTIAPNIKLLNGGFKNYINYSSDGVWDNFDTNGDIVADYIALTNGKTISFGKSNKIYLGAYNITISFKGNIYIVGRGLSVNEVSNNKVITVSYRCMIINDDNNIIITSNSDNTIIEDISFTFIEV